MKIKKILLILTLSLFLFSSFLVFESEVNKGIEEVNKRVPFEFPTLMERDFIFGLDLQGGAHLRYEADLEDVPSGEKSQRMEGLRNLIERRIDLYGVGESLVQVQGERLVVEIPGAHDLDEAIDIIGETPFLDFRETSFETIKRQEDKWKEIEEFLEKGKEEITLEDLMALEESDIDNWEIVLQGGYTQTGLTGRHLKNARVVMHPVTHEPAITLEFDSEGAKLFEEITERNIGKPLATFLDGEILQVATVQEKIAGGEAQITGNFKIEEAYEIARDLRIGALPVPIELISQQSIGPALGKDSLSVSVSAAIFGFLLVVLFMIIVYRLPGLFAAISLSFYAIFVLFLFKFIPITLTLSGIAGFILSIGMAIDANVLIISRLREEIREGKSVKKAVEDAYKRAWPSIRDGNITTLVVAIILFFITTSFVRGFAITLILGILVSLLSAMVISRAFLVIFDDGKLSRVKKLWDAKLKQQ